MLSTALTELLGIEHPIIQAGMGANAGWRLAAAVSEAGGLGTLGTVLRTPDDLASEVEAIRSATSKPFAVNLFCFDLVPGTPSVLESVIDAAPHAVTLSFGDTRPMLERCKEAGLCTSVQVQDLAGLHAALDGGADFVIVQGNEAGGHTGRRGTLNFVAQALDVAGDTPIVAAGGIASGRGLAAALAMGCAGALMGTRFKATPEYIAPDDEKEQIVSSDGANTIYSEITDIAAGIRFPRDVTGRAIRSSFLNEWEGRDDEMRSVVATQSRVAVNWAGESSGLVDDIRPAAEIVLQTVTDAARLLERASTMTAS